jgi:hypothetical protein
VPRALIIEPSGELCGPRRALLDPIERLGEIEVAVRCPPARPPMRELENRKVRVLAYFRALDEKSWWQHVAAAVHQRHVKRSGVGRNHHVKCFCALAPTLGYHTNPSLRLGVRKAVQFPPYLRDLRSRTPG